MEILPVVPDPVLVVAVVVLVQRVHPVTRVQVSVETVEPAEQMKSPELFMVEVAEELEPPPPQVVTPALVAEVLVGVMALVLPVQQIQVVVVVVVMVQMPLLQLAE
jgi:hypothetical protein